MPAVRRLDEFSSSQLAYLIGNREARANLGALLKYVLTLVALYAILFHVIKVQVEAEQHSWSTGSYWTLVVMTTLGFGDITLTSDIGRLISILVLLSGVVLLLVMRPFMFISLFYAPWLEARVRMQAPRGPPAPRERRYRPGLIRPSHHQRRRDKRVSGGLLPPAQPVAADCQPHHARAERRGHPPGGCRLRAQRCIM
jgi:Ion channel